MAYTVSITQKGQMTLPKDIRKRLGVDTPGKVSVDLDKYGHLAISKPVALEDIRSIVGPPEGSASDLTEREKTITSQIKKNPKYAEFFKSTGRR